MHLSVDTEILWGSPQSEVPRPWEANSHQLRDHIFASLAETEFTSSPHTHTPARQAPCLSIFILLLP